jgi:hypothetical protein
MTKFAAATSLLNETLANWDNDDYDFDATKQTIISTLNLGDVSPGACSLRAYKDFFEFWVNDYPLTRYLIRIADGCTAKRVKKGPETLFCNTRTMGLEDFLMFNSMSDNTESMEEIK